MNKSRYLFGTLSRIMIDIRYPKPEKFTLKDIAWGLSMVCRFSGQLPNFYSVAAHSIAVSKWIEENGGTPKEALTGLMHDASEAYLSDVPSPVKAACKDYQKIELKFQKAIAKKFGLIYPFPKIVHLADRSVLIPEMMMQIGACDLPMQNKFAFMLFLERFKELGGTCPKIYKWVRSSCRQE